jgi:hypothetical protein
LRENFGNADVDGSRAEATGDDDDDNIEEFRCKRERFDGGHTLDDDGDDDDDDKADEETDEANDVGGSDDEGVCDRIAATDCVDKDGD